MGAWFVAEEQGSGVTRHQACGGGALIHASSIRSGATDSPAITELRRGRANRLASLVR